MVEEVMDPTNQMTMAEVEEGSLKCFNCVRGKGEHGQR